MAGQGFGITFLTVSLGRGAPFVFFDLLQEVAQRGGRQIPDVFLGPLVAVVHYCLRGMSFRIIVANCNRSDAGNGFTTWLYSSVTDLCAIDPLSAHCSAGDQGAP
jgi:hypothetical protein